MEYNIRKGQRKTVGFLRLCPYVKKETMEDKFDD
jgi:hypothetical protein